MRTILVSLALVGAALGLSALPAAAQPAQHGLVNVYVSDVTVQVPVSVALNLCDVNVAVLVDTFEDEAAECNAEGGSIALTDTDANGDPVEPRQRGLVNVALTDISAQVPIAVAANLCDISVAALVSDFHDDAAACDAEGVSFAEVL